MLQRLDERAERVGGTEAYEGHREGGGDDKPAVEDARMRQFCLAIHDRLVCLS